MKHEIGAGIDPVGFEVLNHRLLSINTATSVTTDLGTITVPVVPGPYWLVYQLDVAGPDAPRNQHAHLACQTIAK